MYNYDGIYMGIVYDTLRSMGFYHEDFYINIKPKCGYTNLIHGPVFTTVGEVVSDNITELEYEKLDNIRLDMYQRELFKNNPIVFLESNDDRVAHSGDLTSLIYKKLGSVGFVTDGNVRDIDIIDEMNFPVFCKDENPIDALMHWAIVGYQTDIEIDGVKVSPNDYAFASRDGVIVVPNNVIDKFKSISQEQLKRESDIRKKIHDIDDAIAAMADFDYKKLVSEYGRW